MSDQCRPLSESLRRSGSVCISVEVSCVIYESASHSACTDIHAPTPLPHGDAQALTVLKRQSISPPSSPQPAQAAFNSQTKGSEMGKGVETDLDHGNDGIVPYPGAGLKRQVYCMQRFPSRNSDSKQRKRRSAMSANYGVLRLSCGNLIPYTRKTCAEREKVLTRALVRPVCAHRRFSFLAWNRPFQRLGRRARKIPQGFWKACKVCLGGFMTWLRLRWARRSALMRLELRAS